MPPHYGIFRAIEKELEDAAATFGPDFEPARPALVNPHARRHGDDTGNLLDSELAIAVSRCFDEAYALMLRMLQFVFDGDTPPDAFLRRMARRSILIMVRVIKPLGELLTRIPAGPSYPGKTAGPSFTLTRHVSLPRDPVNAERIVAEILQETANDLACLQDAEESPPGLSSVADALREIAFG